MYLFVRCVSILLRITRSMRSRSHSSKRTAVERKLCSLIIMLITTMRHTHSHHFSYPTKLFEMPIHETNPLIHFILMSREAQVSEVVGTLELDLLEEGSNRSEMYISVHVSLGRLGASPAGLHPRRQRRRRPRYPCRACKWIIKSTRCIQTCPLRD